jgi:hypothetical protein
MKTSHKLKFDHILGCIGLLILSIATFFTPQGANASSLTRTRLYIVGRATDGTYGITYLTPDGATNGTWRSLDTTPFQGAPALTDNGIDQYGNTTSEQATLWIAGVGTDGLLRISSYQPYGSASISWISSPGATCQGNASIAYTHDTVFVACSTPSTANASTVMINAYNPASATWGGWQSVGGYSRLPVHATIPAPTLTVTRSQDLVIFSLSPIESGHVWYTTYTFGTAVVSSWIGFASSCSATPSARFRFQDDTVVCQASDNRQLYANTFTPAVTPSLPSLWFYLRLPAGVTNFQLMPAVTADLEGLNAIHMGEGTSIYFAAIGNDQALYLLRSRDYYQYTDGTWQKVPLPVTLQPGAAIDFFA